MITSASTTSLFSAPARKVISPSELLANTKRDIALNALKTPVNASEQLAFQKKTSLQSLKNYVNASVKGSVGDALTAKIIAVEGLYAMNVKSGETPPNPTFLQLGGQRNPYTLPKGSLVNSLI